MAPGIIYVAAGAAGFLLSSGAFVYLDWIPLLRGGYRTAGASAAIAGLIGAILAYGHRSGSGQARAYAMQYVVMLVIMGFIFPGIDNYAHAGGFGGGYLAAQLLDPLKPERIDHIAVALVCLVASVVAIVASVLHGLQFVG